MSTALPAMNTNDPTRLVCTCFGAAPASGLDLPGFDPHVRVQDDLFRAVNGCWLEATMIPSDKSRFGSFVQLSDLTDTRLRAIVDELTAGPQQNGSTEAKLAAVYTAFLDTDTIDRAGIDPIAPLLDEIDAISTPRELAQWQGRMQGRLDTPVRLWVRPDFDEPGIHRALTWQGGLGLPDRDYYVKTDDPRLADARAAYAAYLGTLATLSGEPQPLHAAQRVLAIEQRIAQAHWDAVANRDPIRLHNPMTPQALAALAPGFDWIAFLEAAQLGTIDRLSVSQPGAVVGIAQLFAEVPLADWKLYFRLHSLDQAATLLPSAFREARFAFRGTALTGATAEQPRWQQAMTELDQALGEALGQLYVARHFSAEHQQRMQTLVDNLLAAFQASIDGLHWMTAETQGRAQDKLSKYKAKIGYPARWRDYADLDVRKGDALGNAVRSARFEWSRLAARAGQPVDRDEWSITPQTVNAYYDPSRNEIVFPAAILQPPFFDLAADDAVNYGAIGAVIGHEISHGFDDMGSRFDGDGVLRNWWTDTDRLAFEAVGAKLVAQYQAYEPIPGRHVNGQLTLGENIADVSGLQVAYAAYCRAAVGQPAASINGYTGAQRFFLGWSQAWRDKVREERLLQLLTTDPHAPAECRANGAAVNHDGFHAAFATAPGDAMFRPVDQRIRIW